MSGDGADHLHEVFQIELRDEVLLVDKGRHELIDTRQSFLALLRLLWVRPEHAEP